MWLPAHCLCRYIAFLGTEMTFYLPFLPDDTNHLAEITDEASSTRSHDHVVSTIGKPNVWTKLPKLCKTSIYEQIALFWVIQTADRVVIV